MAERRPVLTDPEVLEALAHPVRLDLLGYLMSNGPATASTCARAVGDTPSNCSYHLRTLAKFGLVGEVPSADGRERPWQALVTGIDTDADPAAPLSPQAARAFAVAVRRDQQLTTDYLARRDRVAPEWRA